MQSQQAIELTEEQKTILIKMEKTSDNFFVTGKAGTGKSVLLRSFAEKTTKKIALIAPTGIAAVNIGGQTIHSFFGLDTSVQNPDDPEMLYSGLTNARKNMLSSLSTLIIDEASMIRVDIMDMIDRKLRVVREADIPFGGCQVILFGDLFQLPPVVGKELDVERYLKYKYGTIYFYGAPVCDEKAFHVLELKTVFRQKDLSFIEMLNHIREGNPLWSEIQKLNSRKRVPLGESGIITLTSRNDAAQRLNDEKLKLISMPEFVYEGEVDGTFEEEDMPTSLKLRLKVGAQVMLIRNDSEKRWFNGTLGKVVELTTNMIKVDIEGDIYSIDKEIWYKYTYQYDPVEHTISRQVVGVFRQFPLRLAYAITVHKSQGQTFDSVIIDYSDGAAFAPGQTYVALSRCRSFDTLYLTSMLSREDVRVSQEVVDYIYKNSIREGWSAMIGKDMQVLQGQKFSDSAAALSKQLRAKIQPTIKLLLDNPDSPGLHVEKIGEDGLFSARVDDNYRVIFAIPEGSNILSLLYVGPHEEAYQFAKRYKVEINPITGGLQQVEKAPKRMQSDAVTGKRVSRLAGINDDVMVALDIPEEYWPQLREKVFTAGQLIGFKGLIPEETYDTLEFILDGTPIDEALEIWSSITSTVTPAVVEDKLPMFADFTPEQLVSVGIPPENVDKIRRVKTDKELEIIAASLPVLAQQSLYALKSGETIEDLLKSTYAAAKQNRDSDYEIAAKSPITLAEFAPINSDEALRAILEYPTEKWRVFLHPTQSEIIRQDYNGPARIVGGAGTGKTVVIVHRAKRLAGECSSGEKILVTTFGNTLKHDIDQRIQDICSDEELMHIDVFTVDKLTYDLARKLLNRSITYPTGNGIKLVDVWQTAMQDLGMPIVFDTEFCVDEWRDVIQSQNIKTLDEYLAALRNGRGKKLERPDREKFWNIAARYKELCEQKQIIDADWAQNLLVASIHNNLQNLQYKSVIIDECQDLRTPALRMLRALAGEQRKNDMYLSGDSRQRIYGGRVSLSQCGIAINNRSRVLKLNYRTTAEIYDYAMQLQADYQYDDMDGKSMSKDKATCIFHGPAPYIQKFNNNEQEAEAMIRDIRELISNSVRSSDICIMVRSTSLQTSIRNMLESKGLKVLTVTNKQPDDKTIDGVRIMTMHRGKGMEFTFVYLPCLRDDVLPNKRDLERAEDAETVNDIILSEANLLSVAITRAKQRVWLSYSGTPSTLIRRYIQ